MGGHGEDSRPHTQDRGLREDRLPIPDLGLLYALLCLSAPLAVFCSAGPADRHSALAGPQGGSWLALTALLDHSASLSPSLSCERLALGETARA